MIINKSIDALPNEFGNEVGGVLIKDTTSVDAAVDAIDDEEEEVEGELRIGETFGRGETFERGEETLDATPSGLTCALVAEVFRRLCRALAESPLGCFAGLVPEFVLEPATGAQALSAEGF